MPFKSESQRRFMWAKHPEMAKEWQAHTPKGKKLPEHVKKSAVHEDKIPGGLADKKKPSEFDKRELRMGEKDEGSEHTKSKSVAREIAMDHLAKEPRYYSKMKKMENKMEKKSALDIQLEACWDELEKISKEMPHFTEQDRPAKVKDVYKALKREHPDMPAEVKARIAARKGKKSPQARKPPETGGPSYKAPLHFKFKSGKYKSSAPKKKLKLSMGAACA